MRFGRVVAAMSIFAILAVGGARPAAADEGGLSFWIPGTFSNFASVQEAPGFALPFQYIHTNGKLGSDKNLVVGGKITAGLDRVSDLVLVTPTYTFRGMLLGAQPSIGLGWGASMVDVTASATVTGPGGNVLTRNADDVLQGGTDLYPQGSLKWNRGNNNYMLYVMGGVPVGIYTEGSLANVSINHGAIDGGLGYTFYDGTKGMELSGTLGFTRNFENADTDYQNGVDGHLDWAASKFLSKTTHIGAVGYFYKQLSGDTGTGALLGDFESEVIGVGPEFGNYFGVGPTGEGKGYMQIKTYWEFDAKNRTEGWNFWLTLRYPLGG